MSRLVEFLAELLKTSRSAVSILRRTKPREANRGSRGDSATNPESLGARGVIPGVDSFLSMGADFPMSADVAGIQRDLRAAKLDGWLFYDFRGRDPIAQRILDLPEGMRTRRWFYFVPQRERRRSWCTRLRRSLWRRCRATRCITQARTNFAKMSGRCSAGVKECGDAVFAKECHPLRGDGGCGNG